MQLRLIIGIGIVAAVMAIAGGIWWWQSSVPEPAPAASPVAPVVDTTIVGDTKVPTTPTGQLLELPPLDASDGFVREQVNALSGQLSEWLTQDDLVRRLAVVIDNATTGDYPRRQLGFLAPPEKYPVTRQQSRIFVDPQGYHRFDHIVDAALSVDPQRAAALLENLAPLFAEAMKELGQLDPDPVAAMHKGIEQVLATPVVEGEVELNQPKVFYQYADPQLESLQPLQKQLLRMGPQNLQRLKTYLIQVNTYL